MHHRPRRAWEIIKPDCEGIPAYREMEGKLMENHRRPYFKTPSVAVAYDQSLNLINMPAKDRQRFQSRDARMMSDFAWGR